MNVKCKSCGKNFYVQNVESFREQDLLVVGRDVVCFKCFGKLGYDDFKKAMPNNAAKAKAVLYDLIVELHHIDDWSEDDGIVLWWSLPIAEPPYVGTPLDEKWEERDYGRYYTHWSPLPIPTVTDKLVKESEKIQQEVRNGNRDES